MSIFSIESFLAKYFTGLSIGCSRVCLGTMQNFTVYTKINE